MLACLTVETGAATPMVCDLLPDQLVRMGRAKSNSVVVEDTHASRHHAELYAQDGRWFLRDLDTTNGTKLNGERITQAMPLENGCQIRIGDVLMRFTLETPDVEVAEPTPSPSVEQSLPLGPALDANQTPMHADELSALLRFMNASLQETTPHGLVRLALDTLRNQTQAEVVGFLSLDPDEPLAKLVLPTEAQVDVPLSRQLTQQALRERRWVWLGAARGPQLESESLAAFRDAVCVPLGPPRSSDPAAAAAPPLHLGALHVYRTRAPFKQREVNFCVVLGTCLASNLLLLRSRRALEADNSRLRIQSASPGEALIGSSPAMQQLRQAIQRLAPCPCTVLITGESGVGKELVALGLHRRSSRAEGPLVPVNCATIVSSMAEAELFGHEKGAYSGANRERPGHFQLADGGTLFLDEIGELSLECQAKLLRVLEDRSVRPVGANQPVQVDVRILAATNRDLAEEVRAGRFRRDLFYRLEGMNIKVPPLRERLDDIPELVEHFLEKLQVDYHRSVTLSEPALERLKTFTWPGNVRQLRCVLEAAVAMNVTGVLHAGDLHLAGEADCISSAPTNLNLESLEAWAIRQALVQTAGNNTQAARQLGIHRDTLIAKLKKYGIERKG